MRITRYRHWLKNWRNTLRRSGILLSVFNFLLRGNDQPEYMHPYDAALAGYLYVLSCVDIPLTHKAIEAIL